MAITNRPNGPLGTDALLMQGADGAAYSTTPEAQLKGAPFGGAGVADAWLKYAVWDAYERGLVPGIAQADVDAVSGLTLNGTVTWPISGDAGEFSALAVDIDGEFWFHKKFSITHTPSGKTVTVQRAVTNGNMYLVSLEVT